MEYIALCGIPDDGDSLRLLLKENSKVINKEAKKCDLQESKIEWGPIPPLFFHADDEDYNHFEGYEPAEYNKHVQKFIIDGNEICNESRRE